MTSLILLLLGCTPFALSMNCDYPDDKPCLNVFDSEPADRNSADQLTLIRKYCSMNPNTVFYKKFREIN